MIELLRDKNRRRLVDAAFYNKFRRQPSQIEQSNWCDYLTDGHTLEEMLNAMTNFPLVKVKSQDAINIKQALNNTSITLIDNFQYKNAEDFFLNLRMKINASKEAMIFIKQS